MTRVPEDVQGFLREQVTSYEELETLLLLRTSRNRFWTATELAEALHVRRDDAVEAVERLQGLGLLEARGAEFSYTVSPMEETIARLEEACRESRLEVMKLMSENSVERVRSAAARALADAFILRRGKKDG